MFEAGAPMAPAMFAAGAPMQPTIEAISSSRDGIFDTASTPARSRAVSPIAPPRISNFLLSLAKSSADLGRCHGVFGIGENGHARQESAMRCDTAYPRGRSWRACSWQHARTRPPRGTRAQVLHLGNRETDVVGNHDDARAFEDLAEFLDHFLFLGSIHSFTPSMAGVPAVAGCPRLSFTPGVPGASGPISGSRAKTTWERSEWSRFPSQEGIMCRPLDPLRALGAAHPPSRTGQGQEAALPFGAKSPHNRSCSLGVGRVARIDRHARTHGRAERDLLHVGALGARRLGLLHRIDEGAHVLDQLGLVEGRLADAGMDRRRPSRP